MDNLVFGLMPALIVALSIGSVVHHSRKTRDMLLDGIRSDPEAKYIEGRISGRASFELVSGRYRVELEVRRRRNSNDFNTEQWQIRVRGVDLDPALHCRIEKAGYGSILRNELGFNDIHVGDEDFDRDFDIFGPKEGLIPDLLQDERLRSALRTLYRRRRDLKSVRIGHDACVEATLSPQVLDAEAWHDVSARLATIADIAMGNDISEDALDAARKNTPELAAAQSSTRARLSAVGTSSGSPVGFGSRSDGRGGGKR